MKKSTKIAVVTATLLILSGILLFGGALKMVNFDFKNLSTVEYEDTAHEIKDDFSNISVKSDTASITFLQSTDGNCRVECYEEKNAKHTVNVNGDTLEITMVNEKKWYEHIGINFVSPKITVYLPKTEYSALSVISHTGAVSLCKEMNFQNVDISVTTGWVNLANITADKDINLSVTTGEANLASITCRNLVSSGDTGNINFKNVIASEKLSVERSTGDVTFDRCDAAEIIVKTSTGSVSGSLLSGKTFVAETSTGRISLPKDSEGGRCEIRTSTGNIKITVD